MALRGAQKTVEVYNVQQLASVHLKCAEDV